MVGRAELERSGGVAGPPGFEGRDVCPRWLVGWCSQRGERSGRRGSQVFIRNADTCPCGGDVCPASVPRRHHSRSRAYQLRANITPYDAVYVALAEELNRSVLTPEARLAHAPGPQRPIRVLPN